MKPPEGVRGRIAVRHRGLAAATALGAALFAGCDAAPGRPRAGSVPLTHAQVLDFPALYSDNCSGCHGANGRGGAAIPLADPVYLAIVDEHALRGSIANGVHGTMMPAFAQRAGGSLTDQQIDAIVNGMRSHWSRPGVLDDANPPPYARQSAGDVHRGGIAYRIYCESCHGPGGRGGPRGSAITNDSFLALVSDQGLRTMVIVGRPELGAPDWRGNVPGRPMSDEDITDVVSWLASHRVARPGQPYATALDEE